MILLDTSILSTFAQVDGLDLLWEVFPGCPIGITPAVFREVTAATAHGRGRLEQVPALIRGGRLKLATPGVSEILASEALPDSLGLGEREGIALCKAHGWEFLTNDRGDWSRGFRRHGRAAVALDQRRAVEGVCPEVASADGTNGRPGSEE